MMKIKSLYNWNLIVTIVLLLVCQSGVYSQNKREVSAKDKYAIQQWFDEYHRSKKVTLVNLDKELMDARKNEFMGIQGVNVVVTMIIRQPSQIMTNELEKVIEKDKAGSNDIQEVFMEGYLVSAYYKLPSKGKDDAYLLYRYDSDKDRIILILLSGHINNKQLLEKLVNTKTSKK